MKISTEIDSIAVLVGEEKAVELVANAGFDAWDFSMFNMACYDWKTKAVLETDHPLRSNNYAKFAKKLREIGEDNGIHCNQSHAPFPVNLPEIRSYLKRAIECTAIVGGEICVIHPDNYKSAEENAEMFGELLPFAKECGVKIATENMWDWDAEKGHAVPNACASSEDFNKHLDAICDPYFVACLDLGHAEMRGAGDGAANMIKALGKRLEALHIHDNDLLHDSHQIPFSMDMSWEQIVSALKEIEYKGYFTLEAVAYLKSRSYTAENCFDGVKQLASSARKLADMFEE